MRDPDFPDGPPKPGSVANALSSIAYVGFGSNVGDRAGLIRRAYSRLAANPGVDSVCASSLYQTAPWGVVDQPAFLNAVARFTTTLGPLQLFLTLQKIERELGRTQTFRWGPREIDLDLLLYGNLTLRRRGLVIPHPGLNQRPFVLVPLRELYPDYRSGAGVGIDTILQQLPGGTADVRLYDSSG
jgi:2-amino-4-hydroxy-6-hydroxymethyldihydropteridine diphosphokinase